MAPELSDDLNVAHSTSCCSLTGKYAKKVWVTPFHNEPTSKEDDDLLLLKTDDESSLTTLKSRPKTACAMENRKEDVINGEHQTLVNLLNTMETRRLRRTVYPLRCVSACSFEEKINDVSALNSLYEIYLGGGRPKVKSYKYNGPAVVRFRRISDSELLPISMRNKQNQQKHGCDQTNKKMDNKMNTTATNNQTTTKSANNNKHKNCYSLPITRVDFIREEHIKNVAQRRQKCRGLYSKEFQQQQQQQKQQPHYDVKWSKSPNREVKDSKDFNCGIHHFDHVEYEILENNDGGDNGEEDSSGGNDDYVDNTKFDPYPLASYQSIQHHPGMDHSSTCSSRIPSSKKPGTPQIIIQQVGDVQDIRLDVFNAITKSGDQKQKKRDTHRNCRKIEVKVNSLVNNEEDEDEILYQSSSMKDILNKYQPPPSHKSKQWENPPPDTESRLLNDARGGTGSHQNHQIQSNKNSSNDRCDDEVSKRIGSNNNMVVKNEIPEEQPRRKESNIFKSQFSSKDIDIVVKRNNFLSPTDKLTDELDLNELHSQNQNTTTTSKTKTKPNKHPRSKSAAITVSHDNVSSTPRNGGHSKKITRPKSSKSLKSSSSKEDKLREKERKCDLKKMKELEKAEKSQEKMNKEIQDGEMKVLEQKKALEDNQNDLLLEEERLKQALIEQKSTLTHERKQRRKEEAEKRRQEVERRREEKRLADLEMARKNSELAVIAKEEKEKAEALQMELKRLEEEERSRVLEEERFEKQQQLEREEEEKREIEKAKELERLENLRFEEECQKREQVLMAAEIKLKMLEQEQVRQREQQRLEDLRIQEERELLRKREKARLLEERRLREEERRKVEENVRRQKEEAERKHLEMLNRKRENFDQRKGLAFTKHNQRVSKSNHFSYFVQVPRQTWELPIGWQKRPKYKPGGAEKK